MRLKTPNALIKRVEIHKTKTTKKNSVEKWVVISDGHIDKKVRITGESIEDNIQGY